MLVSKRNFLIGVTTSLLAAPSLIKASSLMPLRGYDMDPWVIMYQEGSCRKLSEFNKIHSVSLTETVWNVLSLKEKVDHLNKPYRNYNKPWHMIKRSELAIT